jgi:hypothetical protein
MGLADDIQALGDQSLAALDASHDYYAYSKRVWRILQRLVSQGREFTFRNMTTGKKVDERELAGLAQRYVTDYLPSFNFQHFVSLFEEFFFGLLGVWLAAYPESLSKKQLELSTVLDAPDKAAITRVVVDKELDDLKRKSVREWFEYLDKAVKLGCPTTDEIESIAEMKASRDILVHNKGIVNQVYVRKAGNRSRYAVGENLEIPPRYHGQCWETMSKVVRDLTGGAVKKARGHGPSETGQST